MKARVALAIQTRDAWKTAGDKIQCVRDALLFIVCLRVRSARLLLEKERGCSLVLSHAFPFARALTAMNYRRNFREKINQTPRRNVVLRNFQAKVISRIRDRDRFTASPTLLDWATSRFKL